MSTLLFPTGLHRHHSEPDVLLHHEASVTGTAGQEFLSSRFRHLGHFGQTHASVCHLPFSHNQESRRTQCHRGGQIHRGNHEKRRGVQQCEHICISCGLRPRLFLFKSLSSVFYRPPKNGSLWPWCWIISFCACSWLCVSSARWVCSPGG